MSRCFRHHQGAAGGKESFGTFGPIFEIGCGQFYLEGDDFCLVLMMMMIMTMMTTTMMMMMIMEDNVNHGEDDLPAIDNNIAA